MAAPRWLKPRHAVAPIFCEPGRISGQQHEQRQQRREMMRRCHGSERAVLPHSAPVPTLWPMGKKPRLATSASSATDASRLGRPSKIASMHGAPFEQSAMKLTSPDREHRHCGQRDELPHRPRSRNGRYLRTQSGYARSGQCMPVTRSLASRAEPKAMNSRPKIMTNTRVQPLTDADR